MTTSQSKIGEIQQKLKGREQDSEIYPKMQQKGNIRPKLWVSDFLPEFLPNQSGHL